MQSSERRCACCKLPFTTAGFGPMEVRWHSSLYGSNHLLCEPCGKAEEAAIDEAGTNDIPDLLRSYGRPNFR